MVARGSLTGRRTQPDSGTVWQGRGSTRSGLVKFIWATVRLVLVNWLWSTSIQLARYPSPLKTFGAGIALLSIALFVWAVWGYWRGFRLLGVKRSMVTIVVVLTMVVALNVLTVPSTLPLGERIVGQVGSVLGQTAISIGEAVQSLFRAPDDFLFAYTGQRASRPLPPGVPTLNPEATPVRISVKPGSGGPPPTLTLRVGDTVEVANTEGQALRARSRPDISSDVVTRFPESTRLLVLEGPIAKNGYTWWKVRSQQGEGWCADRWLVPSN